MSPLRQQPLPTHSSVYENAVRLERKYKRSRPERDQLDFFPSEFYITVKMQGVQRRNRGKNGSGKPETLKVKLTKEKLRHLRASWVTAPQVGHLQKRTEGHRALLTAEVKTSPRLGFGDPHF